MKKLILGILPLEILLIIVVVGYNVFGIGQPKNIEFVVQKELSSNEDVSLNYILKYQMPKGYEKVSDIQGEIAIINNKSKSVFALQDIPKKEMTVEQFFDLQKPQVVGDDISLLSEDTIETNDRIINKKIYELSYDFINFFSFFATVELKDKPDQFIGILGNSYSEDTKTELDLLLNTINYTSRSLEEERTFIDEKQNVSVTVPPLWRRLKDNLNFGKIDQDKQRYILINGGDKKDEDIQYGYKVIKESLLQEGLLELVVDSKVDNIDDKTVTTSIFKGKDKDIATAIVIMETSNSDKFIIFRYDLLGKYDKQLINEDLEYFIKSINLEK